MVNKKLIIKTKQNWNFPKLKITAYNRSCCEVQAIARAHPNTPATPNIIALGKQKIVLANKVLAQWQILVKYILKIFYFCLNHFFFQYLTHQFFLLQIILSRVIVICNSLFKY